MKILDAQQISRIDNKTTLYNQISSYDLMKHASGAFVEWFACNFDHSKKIIVASGVGNNGGDGVSVARFLHYMGYNVKLVKIEYAQFSSKDCSKAYEDAKNAGVPLHNYEVIENIFEIADVIIDAIFGTGLNREISGIARNAIEAINASQAKVISIDVPSGLRLDNATTFAIKAHQTVTFQIPKLALFLPGNYQYVGDLHIVDIGLSRNAIDEETSAMEYILKEDVAQFLKLPAKYAHKGTRGHALIIGGSLCKIGSVCLATKAALKSGCGLVTAYVPGCATSIIQTAVAEAMVLEDSSAHFISEIKLDFTPSAIGIGVGMGTEKNSAHAFHSFLKENRRPLVIDADGLNLLAQHPHLQSLLRENTILTPHPKELERLLGSWKDDFEKIRMTQAFAAQHKVIVIIKGAHTMIVTPTNVFVNSTGTPALATAGSGDVLTGIITSLLAQGYTAEEAAKLGVFLHGLTANITCKTIHPLSFTASDIIDNISNAYFEINNQE